MTAEAGLAELIIGQSPAIRRVRDLILRAAPSHLPVLIHGPTGAGKELVADALHRASGRPGAIVAFNVCAIGDTMFEDTLFGHVRGAYTGAAADRRGYLAEADRGTLFLDEVSGLPMALQAKLLRAVETRTYRPVGSTADRRSDFRLVSATNEELGARVREGLFRADLAHRLSGLVIDVPPLTARRDDIPLLARHFAAAVATSDGTPARLSDAALRVLQGHDWPGNVRELRHVVECAIVLADSPVLHARDLIEVLAQSVQGAVPHDEPLLEERAALEAVLRRCEWNTEAAALELRVHRSTLYRWMKRLGIRVPSGPRVAPADVASLPSPSVWSDRQDARAS
jgi:DNA-binding NtrC family response regulator